jgi:hypothetical protein
MNKENQKNNSIIVIVLGSTAIKILKAVKAIYEGFPKTTCCWPKVIGFDGQNVDHSVCMPTVDRTLEDAKLLPHEVIRADIGDKQSRKKAENQGLLWSLPQDFHINPGAAGENAGVGGDARIGYGLFRLNENTFKSKVEGAMRECLDYQLKNLPANMNGKFATRPVIELFVINTLTGGTGSSSYARAMTAIKQLAEDVVGVDVKITLLSTIIGTLNPGNKPLAAINQQSALKNILARLEYGFTDLDQTDGDLRAVCNPPIFMSNANNYGEMADLNRTLAKVSYLLYLLLFTSFGATARQECVDFYKTIGDQYGTRRKGASIGLSNICFTRSKLIDLVAFDYAENLVRQILCRDQTSNIEKMTDILLSNLCLKETYTQSMAVDRVLSSEKSAHSAIDRVISVFRDRCTQRWGFAGCQDIIFASNYARQNELQGKMIHAVEENTQQWLQSIIKTITKDIKGHLEKINGISLSRQILEKVSESIADLTQKNDNGIFIAKNNDKNIKLNLRHYESIYNKLSKKNWLFRALSFADKDTIKKNYPSIVESDIKNTLQIHARTLLKESIFPQVRGLVANLLDYIGRIENNVTDLGSYYADNVTRLKNLPSYLYDAGGYELADENFVTEKINMFYDDIGNRQAAAKKAFEVFIKKFVNLDAFVKTETAHIGSFIKDNSALTIDTFFKELKVYDVFNQTFPTDRQKTEIVSSIIERSCLSIKISGEGDETVDKVKYICGNDIRLVSWAAKKATEIDRKGGDWKEHINGNLPDGLSFFQYRGNISIAQLMKDTSAIAKLPSDLSELIKIGENPTISTIPNPDCNEDGRMDTQLNMLIAQGIASGAIVGNSSGFELHKPHQEPEFIGKTIEDIRKNMAGNHGNVIYICSKFADSLLKNSSEVITLLKNGNLPQQLDKKAAEDALAVAALSIPYLRKIKKNNNGSK